MKQINNIELALIITRRITAAKLTPIENDIHVALVDQKTAKALAIISAATRRSSTAAPVLILGSAWA